MFDNRMMHIPLKRMKMRTIDSQLQIQFQNWRLAYRLNFLQLFCNWEARK